MNVVKITIRIRLDLHTAYALTQRTADSEMQVFLPFNIWAVEIWTKHSPKAIWNSKVINAYKVSEVITSNTTSDINLPPIDINSLTQIYIIFSLRNWEEEIPLTSGPDCFASINAGVWKLARFLVINRGHLYFTVKGEGDIAYWSIAVREV